MNKLIKKQLVTVMAITALLGTSSITLASSSNNANLLTHGIYIGGSANWSYRGKVANEDIFDFAMPFLLPFPNSGRVFLGYQINDRWGVEAGYNAVDSEKNTYTYSSSTDSTKFYMGGYDLSTLIHFPFANGFDPYLRGGVVLYHVSYRNYITTFSGREYFRDNYYKPAPVIGLGINYVVRKRWPIGLEASYSPQIGKLPYVAQIGLRTSVTM